MDTKTIAGWLLFGGFGTWVWLSNGDQLPIATTTSNTPTTTTGDGTGAAPGPGQCPQHLPQGEPRKAGTESDRLIIRDIYCLMNNPDTKFADWVAYRLDSTTIGAGSEGEQERVWEADPDLSPADTLEPEDYTGAYKALGTDRGHLAPLASFKGANWQQVNYLSNIVPQDAGLNRGEWLQVEKLERQLAQGGEVFVIVGTAYDRPMDALPKADEAHTVPSALWKVIDSGDRVQSWLFENDRSAAGGEIPLEALEQRTGWDFPQNGYQ